MGFSDTIIERLGFTAATKEQLRRVREVAEGFSPDGTPLIGTPEERLGSERAYLAQVLKPDIEDIFNRALASPVLVNEAELVADENAITQLCSSEVKKIDTELKEMIRLKGGPGATEGQQLIWEQIERGFRTAAFTTILTFNMLLSEIMSRRASVNIAEAFKTASDHSLKFIEEFASFPVGLMGSFFNFLSSHPLAGKFISVYEEIDQRVKFNLDKFYRPNGDLDLKPEAIESYIKKHKTARRRNSDFRAAYLKAKETKNVFGCIAKHIPIDIKELPENGGSPPGRTRTVNLIEATFRVMQDAVYKALKQFG